jgi:hypothetical protein
VIERARARWNGVFVPKVRECGAVFNTRDGRRQ